MRPARGQGRRAGGGGWTGSPAGWVLSFRRVRARLRTAGLRPVPRRAGSARGDGDPADGVRGLASAGSRRAGPVPAPAAEPDGAFERAPRSGSCQLRVFIRSAWLGRLRQGCPGFARPRRPHCLGRQLPSAKDRRCRRRLSRSSSAPHGCGAARYITDMVRNVKRKVPSCPAHAWTAAAIRACLRG